MKETIETPNGFDSWYETFYEIASKIAIIQNECLQFKYTTLEDIEDTAGMGGVYEFTRDLTDKFELKYKGKQWGIDDDTQYFDAIDEFLEKELK